VSNTFGWITLPWTLRPDTLVGATVLIILAALLGEVVWRVLRWPRLMGYCAVGAVLALSGKGLDPWAPGVAMGLAVDVALALLLFEAGARVNLRWLRRNPLLLATSLAEAALSAIAVYVTARWLDTPVSVALVLATVTMSVSPGVVLRVISETGAAGQVTERLITLSALNTLYALLLSRLLHAWLQVDIATEVWSALGQALFAFCGSLLLGAVLGWVISLIARRLDLRNENSTMLLLGFVLLALVIAKTLQLSTLLVPLLAGMWLRNGSERPWVWPRHFGTAGGVLVLVLFVAVGSLWSPAVIASGGLFAAAMLCARFVAKMLAVVGFARPSGSSLRQAVALSVTLLPLSATAWVMALEFISLPGSFARELLPPLLAAIAWVELLGPLATLYGLRFAHEMDAAEASDHR
jgi:Kef-type K+ transport system membrane component KefB